MLLIAKEGIIMRRTLLMALAVPVLAVGSVLGWHLLNRPADNHLGDTLRSFGYLPLPLPTSKMHVGSLYVDPKVRFFDVVCSARPSDLEGQVDVASGADLQMDVLTNGQFESTVKLDLGWLLNGSAGSKAKQSVHFSLTDISVETISHEKSRELLIDMANRPHCSSAVADVIDRGGYVCHAVKVLGATAEYKLDRDTQNKLNAGTAQANDVKDLVKRAVETQSGQEVVERQGRLQSGKKLKYAIAMKPTCMAPATGRFARVLPESAFGRVANYLLFNVIESIWPNGDDRTRAAAAALIRMAEAK